MVKVFEVAWLLPYFQRIMKKTYIFISLFLGKLSFYFSFGINFSANLYNLIEYHKNDFFPANKFYWNHLKHQVVDESSS
jgi:hypothetical protein